MQLDLYQINAFTDQLFSGNPACVVPLSKWLADELLLKIALENAVAETAFFVDHGDKFHLRWFTPEMEMDLCGHATLAAAHALKEIRKHAGKNVIFDTSSGELRVTVENGLYQLDLPERIPVSTPLPALLRKSLNIEPIEVLKARDYVLVYNSEKDIKDIIIDRSHFDRLELGTGGVIVTAPGENSDFASRFFTPKASVFEDPVTGSAHCSLTPYWNKKLGKKELFAKQLSQRGGDLLCRKEGERIIVAGKARTYSVGKLVLEED